jgi:hypothetical protein
MVDGGTRGRWFRLLPMTVFAEKLSGLVETILLVGEHGLGDLARAVAATRGRITVAIGSGGSMVTAEFFARCRITLDHGLTIVMTPMQFVLSLDDWVDADVWLFSAGAGNPDRSAKVRKEDSPPFPMKQRRAELFLEPFDGPGKRGLRQMALLGCPGEVERPCCSKDIADVMHLHSRPPTCLHRL